MQESEGSLASHRVGIRTVDGCINSPTNPEDAIPEPYIPGLLARHVDLDEDSTGTYLGNGDEHISELGNTFVSRLPHADDWVGVPSIREQRARACDHAEGFAHYPRPRRDADRLVGFVDSLGEEYDLTPSIPLEQGIDGGPIVM